MAVLTSGIKNSIVMLVNISNDCDQLTVLCSSSSDILKMHKRAEDMFRTCLEIANNIQVSLEGQLSGVRYLCRYDGERLAAFTERSLTTNWDCIHELVAAHILTQPNAMALCSTDASLTYGQFVYQASSIANQLRQMGITPGSKVALIPNKSIRAVVTMLAILQAGGTCVLLNPAYPVEHLTRLLNCFDDIVCLVSNEHVEKTATCTSSLILVIEELDVTCIDFQSIHYPQIDPASTAFIIFTSGSSGNPKGVAMSHMAVSTMAHNVSRSLRMNEESRVLQYAASGWAVNVIETFTTLAAGGCLCIPTEIQRMNTLVETMNQLRVTSVTLTPSLACKVDPNTLRFLKTLVVAGEPVHEGLLKHWSGNVELLMNFGTSETTMSVTSDLKLDGLDGGRPPASVRCWLVHPKDHNKLVPVGGIGELLVESAQVATGYFDNEEENREHFIDTPMWRNQFCTADQPELRFFKSGDLFTMSEDGALKSLGRKDAQLKIRGQRLEPGEVEHHLRQLIPEAKELAVTVCRPQDAKNDLLVAFICFSTSKQVNGSITPPFTLLPEDLEARLAASLPPFMIPAGYYEIDKIPKTISGKISRKEIQLRGTEEAISRLLPFSSSDDHLWFRELTEMERELQMQWSKLLDIPADTIKRHSHFFRVGLDSIDAIALGQNLRRKKFVLDVADIFRYPILADMALSVRIASFSDRATAFGKPQAFSMVKKYDVNELISQTCEQCSVSHDTIEDIYPCTPLQEGLIASTMQKSDAYIAQHDFLLPSNWNVEAFEAALDRVVMSTPVMRTRIVQIPDQGCFQTVLRYEQNLCVSAIRTSNQELPSMGFGDCLFYYEIGTWANGTDLRWTWRIHHALYDKWSTDLFLRAVVESYQTGQTPQLPPFASFVKHLLELDQDLAARYWRDQLGGFNGTIFPRVPQAYLPQPKHIARSSSIRKNGSSSITTPTIVRAAWALLISAHADTLDVVYGGTVSGRTAAVAGMQDMIGPTIATVPVRTTIKPEQPVPRYLLEVQEQSAEMIVHEQYGLQNIQRLEDYGPYQACRFQSLLIVQSEDKCERDPNAQIREMTAESNNYLTYGLTMECTLHAESIVIEASYDSAIIDPLQMDRILQQFDHVLQQLQSTECEKQKVSDIDVLSPADAIQLSQWNADFSPPVDMALHDLITHKAGEMLDEPAICSWEGNYTYRELVDLSNKLASLIVARGIQPETFVPICFEKSSRAVIALLAVLKAGAAFLLIDPSQPAERAQIMLKAVSATHVICSPDQVYKFPGAESITLESNVTITLDAPTTSTSQSLPRIDARNPAYVVFTSGSTGEPKGTVLEHRSASSGFSAQLAAGLFKPGARVLQFASYSFDTCIADIIGTLLAGGCLCIPQDSERLLDLASVINRYEVDMLELTPSVANLLEPHDVPHLKTLRLGGETVTQAHLDRWAGHCYLENSYGPSECVVTCTVTPQLQCHSNPPNFGRGFGCLTWIVSTRDQSKLAAIGQVGELAIQGWIVGRSYINNEEASKRSFLRNPPWLERYGMRDVGAPVYMTGDLVRYETDGSMVFVGRKDNQVKLRGQRIELGEVENIIVADARVRHCLVHLVAEQLVATVEMRGDDSSGEEMELVSEDHGIVEEIKLAVSRALPTYMVPAEWLSVCNMPITRSGKLDRKTVAKWVTGLDMGSIREQNKAASRMLAEDDHLSMRLRGKILAITQRAELAEMGDCADIIIRAAGIDSIRMIGLLRWINAEFKIQMTVDGISRHIYVTDLARAIEHTLSDEDDTHMDVFDTGTQLLDEIKTLVQKTLDVGSPSCIAEHSTCSLQRVLLTGATGYLGTQLLRQLLSSSDVHIVTLVRARTEEQARRRIVNTANLAGWWTEEFCSRLTIWLGDIAKPRCGLTSNQWAAIGGPQSEDSRNRLGQEQPISTILHNAAVVDWSQDYRSLRSANVLATQQLLAATKASASVSRFVYVSGGPQFDPNDEDDVDDLTDSGIMLEDDDSISRPTHSQAFTETWQQHEATVLQKLITTNGYGQSKLVAEEVVEGARRNSSVLQTRVCIINPGLVIGTASEGIPNVDDFIWRLVKGCVRLGSFPMEASGRWIYVCGADLFAQVCAIALRTNASDKAAAATETSRRKLVCGMEVGAFWSTVNEVLPQTLQVEGREFAEWMETLKEDVEKEGQAHACWPILHMFEGCQGDVLGEEPPRQVTEEVEGWNARVVVAVRRNVEVLVASGFFGQNGMGDGETDKAVFRRRMREGVV